MKKQLKQSKISIISILCVSILIFGISIFSSMRVNATTIPSNPQSYSSLTPHDPIFIDSDEDFLAFPGSGTTEDPYIIEGYNITTTGLNGIYITDTTKYFIVRNCYVDAENYGIYVRYADYGTATIFNNTCENNENHGIYLENSGSTVENNTCSNNNRHGILLYYSGSSNVTDNTCNNNGWDGIDLLYSGSSNVINNTCNINNNGISLENSGSSNVTDNTCSNNNNYGINVDTSGSSTVSNNMYYNNWGGITLSSSDSCVLTSNLLLENENYGIRLYSGCDNNIIHHNNFVDNNPAGTSQGDDDGT